MTNDADTNDTPDPVAVAPEDEPDQIFPSATGVVVPGEEGEGQSAAAGTPSEDAGEGTAGG